VKTIAAISAATCAAALALAVPATASASVGVDSAAAFTSNGTLNDGWYWVDHGTESATWTFNITSLDASKPGAVYLNVEALVSNRPAGGSGYSARGVRFVATCGQARQVLTVKLINHFRPIFPGDTFGIGYAAAGHSSDPLRLKRFSGCSQVQVRVDGPFASDRAIGFTQSSATLGYS
jgi:hypothetical protein